jgi:hypothetical protein
MKENILKTSLPTEAPLEYQKSFERSSFTRNKKKLKRRPIKKVVHNVCISYKAADGTIRTIIHQKVENF